MASVVGWLRDHAVPVGVVVLLVALAVWGGGVLPRSRLIDQPAPDWTLPLAAGSGQEEGDRLALRALRGQVVLMEFWASWCPPCRKSAPILSRVARSHPRALKAIGINVEGGLPASALASAHRAFGYSFPTVQDRNGAIQAAYGVRELPTLVLVGTDGIVRDFMVGVPDEAELQERLAQLIGAGSP